MCISMPLLTPPLRVRPWECMNEFLNIFNFDISNGFVIVFCNAFYLSIVPKIELSECMHKFMKVFNVFTVLGKVFPL